jgi:hypothetical protein
MTRLLPFVALRFSPFFCLAQSVTLPYNPDTNQDSAIGTPDLLDFLPLFGGYFAPDPITVNSVELATFLMDMQNSMLVLQAQIELLQEEVDSLQGQVVPHLANYLTVDVAADAVVFSGADVHVNNGQESTYSSTGRGNLIVGYNEPSPNVELERSGSHNLIMGATNDYTGVGSIVTGQSNKMYATEGLVTGFGNVVTGIRSAVIGGNHNTAGGELSVIISGQQNVTTGNDAAGLGDAVVGGVSNEADGIYVVIAGGNDNLANGENSAVIGGSLHHAMGYSDAIFGGELGITDGLKAVVSGGYNNHASGSRSVIFGGMNNVTDIGTSPEGYGVFGGTGNMVFDGCIYGGKSNVNRGEGNVIVGGNGNELLNALDEDGFGVYNRWSVIVGGFQNLLPSETEDFSTVLGRLNRSYVGTPGADAPYESLHIQLGLIAE